MHVEIKNRDAFRACREGFERGDGDIVQIAEAHRVVARRVMARRTHEAENHFAVARGLQRVERGGGGCAGERGNVVVKRRVTVEILRFVQPREMPRRMGAQDLRLFHAGRRGPDDGQFSLAAQVFHRAGDARRSFGMAGLRIAGTLFVGDDGHERYLTTACRAEASGEGRMNPDEQFVPRIGMSGRAATRRASPREARHPRNPGTAGDAEF